MAMQPVCLDQRVREFTENISNASPERRVELQGTFSKAIGRLWGTFATLESQFPMFFFLFIQYSVSSDSPRSFFLVIVCSSNMCLVLFDPYDMCDLISHLTNFNLCLFLISQKTE